jgi:serine protease Do
LQLTVGETPEERGAARRQQGKKPAGETLGKLGLTVSEVSAEQRRELNVTGGVLVEAAEGAAAKAGIRRGDVILAVNNQEIKSVDEFTRLVAPADKPRTVALLVKRKEGSIYVPLRVNGGAN